MCVDSSLCVLHAALAIAPDGRTIASGQACTTENSSPPVCVWDSSTMMQKARLNVNAVNEIAALAFSPDGSVLLSVSKDENFTITLTEWATGAKLAVARYSLCLTLSLPDSLTLTHSLTRCVPCVSV